MVKLGTLTAWNIVLCNKIPKHMKSAALKWTHGVSSYKQSSRYGNKYTIIQTILESQISHVIIIQYEEPVLWWKIKVKNGLYSTVNINHKDMNYLVTIYIVVTLCRTNNFPYRLLEISKELYYFHIWHNIWMYLCAYSLVLQNISYLK